MELDPTGKIILISSGQPSLNPRLVKEADALTTAGYSVTVLYSYWNDWGTELDKGLLASKKWKAKCVGGDPLKSKTKYFFSRLIYRISRAVNRSTKGKYLGEYAISRAGYFLTREAKNYLADIYIGHNLGALAAAVRAAKTNQKPCGFDLEDFHRYEISNDRNNYDVLLKTHLENKYLPKVNYLTASSPLIADAYHQLFPAIKPVTILNVFPVEQNVQDPTINQAGSVKLFWFSQTIGPSRGLDDIINALGILKEYPFELHLLGYLSKEVKENYIDKLIAGRQLNISFHSPVPSNELTNFSNRFDIGLALEPGFSINNETALSNKIFTYMQAGLGIIASDTPAQFQFVTHYDNIGKVYQKGNAQSLADILLYYHLNRGKLLEIKRSSISLARQSLNWQTESKKFLSIIEQTLQNS